jgi:pilus assembly protein TadC
MKPHKKPLFDRKRISLIAGASLMLIIVVLIITKNTLEAGIWGVSSAVLLIGMQLAKQSLEKTNRVKKIEAAFPDFLDLVSSNLRAGMTVDKALLTSSREEFAPLDKEIMQLGKDLVTGKQIEQALKEMGERIQSEKINKTLALLITSIRSGGNLATLLEETAVNVRERNFLEKKASSNVLMYVIFIFFAIAVGAPALFALSSVLVQILSTILGQLPDIPVQSQLPFALTKITVSPEFVKYFAILFIMITNILGSLVLGTVSKGEEKEGVKYILPLTLISLTVFFLVRIGLSGYFSELLG